MLVCSALIFPSGTSAANFSYYGVGKGVCYDQTNGGLPKQKRALPWVLEAQLVPTTSRVLSVELKRTTNSFETSLSSLHGYTPLPITLQIGTKRSTDQPRLDSTYTNGSFWLKVSTTDEGVKWLSLELAAGVYPAAPNITNLVAAQSIDPTTDFVLRWAPFLNATSNDFILCDIQSGYHSSYVPGSAGALNGQDQSFTIPAGTLLPGKVYICRLVFVRVQSTFTNDYPGAFGTAYLFSQTEFHLRTLGAGDTDPPVLVWSNPQTGATNVPKDMPLTIEFSKPMGSGISFSAVGFGPTLTWSADRTKLYLSAAGFGGSSLIRGVLLNPYDSFRSFSDGSGNRLAETGFSFETSTNLMAPSTLILTNSRCVLADTFETEVRGIHGADYTLQSTTDFTDWLDLSTNQAVGGVTHFIVTNKPTAQIKAFRAMAK